MQEFEIYHGACIAKLVHACNEGIFVSKFSSDDNAGYVINGKIGFYIKHSSARLTPWAFSFSQVNQKTILNMRQSLESFFLLLVCQRDGIACIKADELPSVLDDHHKEVEWIRVTRPPRGSYHISGSDGRLETAIPMSRFPKYVVDSLRQSSI